MRNLLRALGLFLCLGTCFGSPVLSKGGPPESSKYHPNPEEGKNALAILPAVYGDQDSPVELLNPEGLEVHLTPYDDPEVELIYPAGRWIQPPAGSYRYWLQGDWRMTPFSGLLMFSGHSGNSIVTTMRIGEAGRVVLSQREESKSHLELRLLHAGSYLEEGQFLRWELSPRRAADELGAGMLMPVGRAIGGLWDRKAEKYVAFSRPFEVRWRKTVEVPLERPEGVMHLVAEVLRSPMPASAEDLEVRLTLNRGAIDLSPDLKVLTAEKIYAVWYGLVPGTAELHVESRNTFLDQRIDIKPGSIEYVTGQLEPLPSLDVDLDLPALLRHENLALEVRMLPTGEIIERQALKPGTQSHRFDGLPPALLQVDLQTSLGPFSREVDLSSREDGFLLLKPELITLLGTVYFGDKGHSAKLTFADADSKSEIRTEEDGRYEIVLLDPVQTVSIDLGAAGRAPFVDFFLPAIRESQELDFHLSTADFHVRVIDRATGRGIPNASVDIRNNFVHQVGQGEKRKGTRDKIERAVFQSVKTDEKGRAQLPPLREGSLEIRTSAEGYSRLQEPLKAQVTDDEGDQTFEILLEPVGETIALRLNLPGGAPAAGAQVLLVDSLAAGNNLFSARADGEGVVRAPRNQRGTLLVRHSAAAFSVREWQPQEDEGEMVWSLPKAAGRPLILQVRDAAGTRAAPKADLALWVGGQRLSGWLLAWLADTESMADAHGYWMGKNLPPGPVKVLAWTLRAQQEAQAGHLELQASQVEFPWAEPVEVRAVE